MLLRKIFSTVGFCAVVGVSCGFLVNAMAQERSADTASISAAQISVVVDGKVALLAAPESYPAGLWIDFANGEKITKAYRDVFASRGYKLAESKDSASARLHFAALFRFMRPQERMQSIDVGRLLDSAQMKGSIEAAQELANENRGATLRNVSIDRIMLGSFNWWAGATVLDTLLDVGGARAGFNKMIAGDARGFCLFRCENWNKYSQEAIVAVTLDHQDGSITGRVVATANEKQLLPQELFDKAMADVTNRLFDAANRIDEQQ